MSGSDLDELIERADAVIAANAETLEHVQLCQNLPPQAARAQNFFFTGRT